MTGLCAGNLDRMISIDVATTASNAMNESVETWSPLARVWASATPVKDGERFQSGEVTAEITMRFQVRYQSALANLDERNRVVFDGRTYDVHGVKEIGRQEGLEISASARSERV